MNLDSSEATISGISGRGPTRLISPFRTCQIWGSSLMWRRRRTRPTRVTRSLVGPVRATLGVRIGAHRPELDQLDLPAPLADPRLPVEDGPAVGELDRERGERRIGAAMRRGDQRQALRSSTRFEIGQLRL